MSEWLFKYCMDSILDAFHQEEDTLLISSFASGARPFENWQKPDTRLRIRFLFWGGDVCVTNRIRGVDFGDGKWWYPRAMHISDIETS